MILDWRMPWTLYDLERFNFTGSDMRCCIGVCKSNFLMMEEYYLEGKFYQNVLFYWINDIDPNKAQVTIY